MEKRSEGRGEIIIDPTLPIVDAHFHLFDLPEARYMFDDYLEDVQAGHNIVASVYIETAGFLRPDGPEVLRPLGEIEFANGVGAVAASGRYGKTLVNAAIVGHADLRHGNAVAELFDRGLQLAPDRLRGFRQVALDHPSDEPYKFMLAPPPKGLLSNAAFRDGFRHLAERKLTFDATVFHTQLADLIDLVDAFPDTTIILDHLGMPMQLGADGERAERFKHWRKEMERLSERPNTRCKVGGLGMPFSGFGFEQKQEQVGYRELADAWAPYVETAIKAFGTERCMMESNFPPDGYSAGYVPVWNAMKYITRDFTANEKADLFHRTAMHTYRISVPGL
ncbi:amidohydrolase family protein [Granulicella cerasi]|uniref:Amidohydrolase family protein n=1 Tax=Granulicella cerasi TaxID=741063 RepID=A0ABW1ZDM0_9BACT|nr:amidohydrolase family protein [Granulicella cerasi]